MVLRCLMFTETIRLIRDGKKGGRGYGGGVERVIIYLSLHCHTRMTSALRWAALRAILMLHNCAGQSHETVSTNHNWAPVPNKPTVSVDVKQHFSINQPINTLPIARSNRLTVLKMTGLQLSSSY